MKLVRFLLGLFLLALLPAGLAYAYTVSPQIGLWTATVPLLMWAQICKLLGWDKNLKVVAAGYWLLSIFAFADIFVSPSPLWKLIMVIIMISGTALRSVAFGCLPRLSSEGC